MHSRSKLALVAVGLALMCQPLSAQQVLNVGPLVVKMDAIGEFPSLKRFEVDNDALVDRCRDFDGCTVTMRLQGAGQLKFDSFKLHQSRFDLNYVTSLDPLNLWLDGDNNFHTIKGLLIDLGGGNFAECRFDDRELNPAIDSAEGFTVLLDTQFSSECFLSIED